MPYVIQHVALPGLSAAGKAVHFAGPSDRLLHLMVVDDVFVAAVERECGAESKTLWEFVTVREGETPPDTSRSKYLRSYQHFGGEIRHVYLR